MNMTVKPQVTASIALEAYLKLREGGPYLTVYDHLSGDPTIAWGHKWKHGDPTTITLAEAGHLFYNDLQVAVNTVNDLVLVPLLPCQADALISAFFNLGAAGLAHTQFLRFINNKQFFEAIAIFPQFCHYKGQANDGLLIRRLEESLIFLGRGSEVTGYGARLC
jgi:GH24 family phage-related lysozyme (muramidase)